MGDKEFKKFSRADLVEVIYRLQENEDGFLKKIEVLEKENGILKAELNRRTEILNRRETIHKSAGSIAKEVVELSGIFDYAQKVADRYVAEVANANASSEAYVTDEHQSMSALAPTPAPTAASATNAIVTLTPQTAPTPTPAPTPEPIESPYSMLQDFLKQEAE